MRLAMLAQAGSVHTGRWSTGLAARSHEVRIFSNSELLTHPDGIDTVFLPGRSAIAYVRNIPRIKRLVNDFRPDIVHAHYATGYGLWGAVQKSAPLIVSVWGTDIDDALQKKFTVAPITRRALRAARFVTATSRYLLDKTRAFEPSISAKCEYVPFGVPISGLPTHRPSDDDGIIRIIFAKAYLDNYAPDMVIRAFAEARRSAPLMSLTMVGGGPMQGILRKLVGELKLENHVTIGGFVASEEAHRLIREADVMVMPSCRESFGVAAVEAASCGLPVIATNVGGIPEIIEDGVNGILIRPGDEDALVSAMVRLASDVSLIRRMGMAGREIAVRKFDFSACLDKMEKLYRRILET